MTTPKRIGCGTDILKKDVNQLVDIVLVMVNQFHIRTIIRIQSKNVSEKVIKI